MLMFWKCDTAMFDTPFVASAFSDKLSVDWFYYVALRGYGSFMGND